MHPCTYFILIHRSRNIAVLQLELESFKKGYQEMRKMYEEYVRVNEQKWEELSCIIIIVIIIIVINI